MILVKVLLRTPLFHRQPVGRDGGAFHPGDINSEAVICLPGGGLLGATMTSEGLRGLALETGKPVATAFDPEAAILGMKDPAPCPDRAA